MNQNGGLGSGSGFTQTSAFGAWNKNKQQTPSWRCLWQRAWHRRSPSGATFSAPPSRALRLYRSCVAYVPPLVASVFCLLFLSDLRTLIGFFSFRSPRSQTILDSRAEYWYRKLAGFSGVWQSAKNEFFSGLKKVLPRVPHFLSAPVRFICLKKKTRPLP